MWFWVGVLGRVGDVLGKYWSIFGAPWASLGRLGSPWGVFGAVMVSFLKQFGAKLKHSMTDAISETFFVRFWIWKSISEIRKIVEIGWKNNRFLRSIVFFQNIVPGCDLGVNSTPFGLPKPTKIQVRARGPARWPRARATAFWGILAID